jgi:hypothetical protein
MKKASLCLFIAGLLASAVVVRASGPIDVYAMVEKVVMEPNESTPERIQIWGAFSLRTGDLNRIQYAPAQAGYLYYKIDPSICKQPANNKDCIADVDKRTRAMWSDIKKTAGKGEAISFGGNFGTGASGKLRNKSDKPASPDIFSLGNPVVALGASQKDIVESLKAALKKSE